MTARQRETVERLFEAALALPPGERSAFAGAHCDDPEVRRDFERFFSRLAPDGDSLFQHTCEGDDDMPAHVRTALTTVNLSVPIRKSRLVLGTWQGIYLWEHRLQPHQRRVVVHLIGE